MEIYFHSLIKQLINLDCDIFGALLVFFSVSSLHPDLDARSGCLSPFAEKKQPHREETDKPGARGGGRDAKGLGSNPPGCLKGLTHSASLPPARSPGEAGKLRLGTSLSLLTPRATPGEAGTAAMLRPRLRERGRCAGPAPQPGMPRGCAARPGRAAGPPTADPCGASGTRLAGSQAPPEDPLAWLRGRSFSQQFPLSLLHSTLHLPADV